MLIRLRDEDFSGAKSEEGEVAGRHDTCRQKDHKDAKLIDGKPPFIHNNTWTELCKFC